MNKLPHDFVGCNVHETDRQNIDRKLTKGEIQFALFCMPIFAFFLLFELFNWVLQILTR